LTFPWVSITFTTYSIIRTMICETPPILWQYADGLQIAQTTTQWA
jgi:hypothetical protein